jgi:hypothetical protein
MVRELERVIYGSWGKGFTWSPYPMRGHLHRHKIRALKFIIGGSPTDMMHSSKKNKKVIKGNSRGWFYMVTLPMRGRGHR